MLVFAIESSSQVAGAAIVDGDRVIAECTLNKGLTHSEVLMPLVDSVFKMSGIDVSDIDLFAVSKGPGSFTGLRIGIATIKGLAQSKDRPVIGISTLDGLAYNIQHTSHIVCPILNARREQVYTSIYEYVDDGLLRQEEYMAVSIYDLIERLEETGKRVVFTGDGVQVYGDIIREHMGDSAIFAPAPFREQRASSIGALARDLAADGYREDFRGLKPFYLRKSQAEQSRDRQIGER